MGDDPDTHNDQENIVTNEVTSIQAALDVEHDADARETGADRDAEGLQQTDASGVESSAILPNEDSQRPPTDSTSDVHEVEPSVHAEHDPADPHNAAHDLSDDPAVDSSALSTPAESVAASGEVHSSMLATGSGLVHPGPAKRFVSSANINKKFLQKTSTAPSPAPAVGKGATPSATRPASITPSQSQSRLVTTKLTMVAPAVVAAAAGWNKGAASSGNVSPQPAATPVGTATPPGPLSAKPSPVNPGAPAVTTSAPAKPSPYTSTLSIPSAPGPATSPSPTASMAASSVGRAPGVPLSKTSSAPKAWGQLPPAGALSVIKPPPHVDAEFPTAAEAAKGRRLRAVSPMKSEIHHVPLADTSADAFRGVHLDPNAHHWDEMEDEDNDFLAGEVEFGDGRQYKVAVTETVVHEGAPVPALPVSKEERFSDDFDRSWPRSAPLQPLPQEETRHHPQISPTGEQRALFNERSNRLEPWQRGPQPPQAPQRRRNSNDEHGAYAGGRDLPPHQNVHVLHKDPRASHLPPRDRYPERQPSLMSEDSGRLEASLPERTVPSRGMDSIRQLPPHLAHAYGPPPRDTRPTRDEFSPPSATSSTLPRPHMPSFSSDVPPVAPLAPLIPPLAGSISTAPDSLSLKSASPEIGATAALSPSGVDVGELHKLAMHSAAERAKRRRQEEEEEREREKERARKKAHELEERFRAVEVPKQQRIDQEQSIPLAQEQRRLEEAERRAQMAPSVNGIMEDARSPSTDGQSTRPLHTMPSRPPPRTVRVPGITAQVAELIEPASTRSASWRSAKPAPAAVAMEFLNAESPFTSAPVVTSSSDWTMSPAASSTASLPSRPYKPPVDIPRTMPPKMVSPIVSTVAEVLAFDSGGEVEEMDYADMSRLTRGKDDQRKDADIHHLEGSPFARLPQMASIEELAERYPQPSIRPRTERVPSTLSKSDVGPWRRVGPLPATSEPSAELSPPAGESHASTTAESSSTLPPEPLSVHNEDPSTEPPIPRVSVPGSTPVVVKHQHSLSLPKHAYREPTISTLDDTMSRIMGALGAMQEARDHALNGDKDGETTDVGPSVPRNAVSIDPWLLEVLSHIDRPVSPPLVWRSYPVRVPKQSRPPSEGIAPLRLQAFLQQPPPASMDILCWVPPVKDMSIRTLSRDDLFFRKTYTRGVVNARVLLPQHDFVPYEKPPVFAVVRLPMSEKMRAEISAAPEASVVASAVPRVLLPKSKASTLLPRDVPESVRQQFAGHALRHIGINGIHDAVDEPVSSNGLKLVSRSPPPELSYALPSTLDDFPSMKAPLTSTPRGRAPPRMPEGVNLVLYNSPNGYNMAGDASTVKFTVSSEIDADDSPFASPEDHVGVEMAVKIEQEMADHDVPGEIVTQLVDPAGSTKSSEESGSSMLSNMLPATTAATSTPSPEIDSLKSASSVTPTKSSTTPATGMTPNIWGKSLLPDPEHLKAVWSQPSGLGAATENSLRGISDEFPTVLPVSLQELRSEDGDVPGLKTADGLAPSGLMATASADTPARPSLFDPHKSFQQVPTQPSTTRPFASPASYPSSNMHSYANSSNSNGRPHVNTPAHHIRPFPAAYTPIGPAHSPSPPIMFASTSPYGMVMPSMAGSHGLAGAVSPPGAQRLWMPQHQASTPGSYMPAGSTYPNMMAYTNPGTIGQVGRPYQPMPASSKAPGAGSGDRSMIVPGLHNASIAHTNSIGAQVSPAYTGIGNLEHLPGYSQQVHGSLAQSHVPYSPHLPNNSQPVYGVPIGAGRGSVRNAYDSGYQQVPPGSFARPSGW